MEEKQGGGWKSYIPLIASVGGAVAGGLGGGAAQKQDAKSRARELAQQQQQFNAQFEEDQRRYNNDYRAQAVAQNVNSQSQYGDRAQSVNRELEMLPMRDKASALLMQRMGAPAQQATPRSLAGGGTDALRGGAQAQLPYDLNAAYKQAQAYKAGDGGMTGDVQRQLLERYMNVPQTPELEQSKLPNPRELSANAAAYEQWLIDQPGDYKVGERERLINKYVQQQQAGGQYAEGSNYWRNINPITGAMKVKK